MPPGALRPVCFPPDACLAGVHRRLADQAKAIAVGSLLAALTATFADVGAPPDVGAHGHLASALAPHLGVWGAAVEAKGWRGGGGRVQATWMNGRRSWCPVAEISID